MMITLQVTQNVAPQALVRTFVSSGQEIEAGRPLEITFDYTQDMGPILVVLDPSSAGVRQPR